MSESDGNTRTALVTGGAKRIGREIALDLARHGWQVAVHFRSGAEDAARTADECSRLGHHSAVFRAELTDEEDVRALVPSVIARFGRLDALVNSASTFELDDTASFSFQTFDRHMHANVAAPVLLSQALQTHLEAAGRSGCWPRPGPNARPGSRMRR